MKLEPLTAYLQTKLKLFKLRPENINWQIEDGTIDYGNGRESEAGIELLRVRYQSVIFIDRVSEKFTGLILALIIAWLKSNDGDRQTFGLQAPNFVTVQLDRKKDQGLVNLEVYIEFIDPIHITPDPDGPIALHGKNYTFGPHTIDVAESGVIA